LGAARVVIYITDKKRANAYGWDVGFGRRAPSRLRTCQLANSEFGRLRLPSREP